MTLVPKWWIQKIDNFINKWKRFKMLEVELHSDEWFQAEMLKVNPRGIICESHRQAYKAIDEFDKEEAKKWLQRAYIQGQKMDNKLKEYKVYMNG